MTRPEPQPATSPRHRAIVAAVLVLGTFAFMAPMFAVPDGIASGDAFRDNDWLNCRAHDVMSRLALLEYGQFPLRCHLIGGGFPLVGHPSDGTWAPTIVAVLLFGDVIGVKINLLWMVLVGVFGTYGLARRWLDLPVGPSVFTALLFGFSAWAPSMLLVGFYNQVFYVLVPAILFLTLTSAGRLARLLWAGLLLCFVLQQGGNAFPTVCHFLGVVCWLVAAREVARDGLGWRAWAEPLALLVLVSATVSFARGFRTPLVLVLGWGPAVAWAIFSPVQRRFVKALRPWIGRLSVVVVVAMVLGAGRIAGLIYMTQDAQYDRGLDELIYWFPRDDGDEYWVERFYETPMALCQGLTDRVPSEGAYDDYLGAWEGENTSYEYAFLGLTLSPLFLALLAAAFGRPRRRATILAAVTAIYGLICIGWVVWPDFHFLLVWGFPWLGDFGQPLKYYNFYMLLPLVLLAGVGATRLVGGVPPGITRIAVLGALAAMLVLPFAQNRPILGELFTHPRPPPDPAAQYHQVALIGNGSWIPWGEPLIREASYRVLLREFRRPEIATEYFNAPRGIGVVDWYGTVIMPEYAVPRSYITLEGVRIDNPRYRGEAWIEGGYGHVRTADIRPNTIDLVVDVTGPARVVVNQNWLPGFHASVGDLEEHEGLLAVDLQEEGEHEIRLTYRPPWLLLGLGISATGFVAWIVAQVLIALRSRRR